MSLDKLTIIFFIIVLPIALVLNVYIGGQVDTLELQISYDNKLKSSTYDAMKAFQRNTLDSSTSDLANSKIRDIEASVNMFFNSMAGNFNITGYNTDTLQEYVPALVYTMYDGYYIYSSYTNKLEESDEGKTYRNKQKLYGLKPYIYYSCRYKDYPKNGDDFVITYSLDNYITIQGKIGDKIVNDSGYLISNIKYNESDSSISYKEIKIEKESILKEKLINDNGNVEEYQYHKINGVKYYYDEKKENWFSLLNQDRIYTDYNFDTSNDSSAYNYYKEAYEFMEKIKGYGIGDLNTSNATENELRGSGYKIFDDENIEEPNSNFNQHRLAVIRYSIEKNLSIAIANYNNYTNVKTNFLMPELKEDEWDKILNNVSLISFMQGLNIGGKVYNGYAIVTNNNNEEVVTENSIYIANKSDQTYHNVLEKGLNNNINNNINNNYIGIFNMDLNRKSKETDLVTKYYYPKLYYADYDSIVYPTNVGNLDEDEDEYNGNIYEYLDKNGNKELAKIYYTALGRERYSMYKVNRNVEELLKQYTNNS